MAVYSEFDSDECNRCSRRLFGECMALSKYNKPCGSFTDSHSKVAKEYKDMINFHLSRGLTKTSRVVRELKTELDMFQNQWDKELGEVYLEDKHRGSGGGSSESDANKKTSLKQKMKDNRSLDTKLPKEEQARIIKATKDWEEETGIKLDKFQPNLGITRTDKDSYIYEDSTLEEESHKYPKKVKRKKTKK